MSFKFNPFTGTFDIVNDSQGGVIDTGTDGILDLGDRFDNDPAFFDGLLDLGERFN
ncbi:MAG: hypothetical protein HRT70_01305 [Flavobacteriaceae bacterium]|nr:hypothetical protein [Flavobacteriaceae bacterium]